eukprot:3398569-Prorocentrum_lima.AAC.1
MIRPALAAQLLDTVAGTNRLAPIRCRAKRKVRNAALHAANIGARGCMEVSDKDIPRVGAA